jgi:hypothetical protein
MLDPCYLDQYDMQISLSFQEQIHLLVSKYDIRRPSREQSTLIHEVLYLFYLGLIIRNSFHSIE